jgi:phage gp29-like protein
MVIKDMAGEAVKTAQLDGKQTSQIVMLQREFAQHPSRGLTPAGLADILQQAEFGYIKAQHELFLDMEEKDAHIYAEMGKRKRAMLTLDWSIVAPRNASAGERKLAGYVQELMQDIPNFEDVILDALDAVGHGFACQEIEWELLGSEWLPRALFSRPQSWFQTDRDTRTQIRLRDATWQGQALNPFGWMTHVHKAKSGYLSRAGLHRVLAWPYLYKNYAIGDLAEFLEIYGMPLRLGTYQPGASEDEKDTLMNAVMSIGHDAAGIIPEGMMIEFKDAAKGASDPYEAMISWCERSQSKAILGGTLTSQADGKSSTHALGKVHNEMRHDLLVSDAIQLGQTLTRDLVYPLLALNKGGVADRRRMPQFVFNTREVEDLGVLAEALPKLVGVGFKIPVDWAHEHSGIPFAEDGVEVLSIAVPERVLPFDERGAPAPAAATAALVADPSAPDPIADLHDGLSQRLAVEIAPAWNDVLAQLRTVVAAATSLEGLRDDLLAAFADLPRDEMTKVMAAAFAVAELAGIGDVRDGQ